MLELLITYFKQYEVGLNSQYSNLLKLKKEQDGFGLRGASGLVKHTVLFEPLFALNPSEVVEELRHHKVGDLSYDHFYNTCSALKECNALIDSLISLGDSYKSSVILFLQNNQATKNRLVYYGSVHGLKNVDQFVSVLESYKDVRDLNVVTDQLLHHFDNNVYGIAEGLFEYLALANFHFIEFEGYTSRISEVIKSYQKLAGQIIGFKNVLEKHL